jgi:hypothetical protein
MGQPFDVTTVGIRPLTDCGTELPPGGVDAQDENDAHTRDAQQQTDALLSLIIGGPGAVANATLDAALGLHEIALGVPDGIVDAASVLAEPFFQLWDVIALPTWAAAVEVDHHLQFLQSGQWRALRYGPAPSFTGTLRIPPPPIASEAVRAVVNGVPATFGKGRAGNTELLLRSTPPVAMALMVNDAWNALFDGDLRKVGRFAGNVGTLALVAGVATKAGAAPGVRLVSSQTAAVTDMTPPGMPISMPNRVPSAGRLHLPPSEFQPANPRLRAPLDRIGEGPRQHPLAAIDDELGGGGESGPVPGAGLRTAWPARPALVAQAGRWFRVDAETAARLVDAVKAEKDRFGGGADTPAAYVSAHDMNRFLASEPETVARALGLSYEASAETVALRFDWTLDQLDDAIQMGDPRLIGTWLEDPVGRDPVLLKVVQQQMRSDVMLTEGGTVHPLKTVGFEKMADNDNNLPSAAEATAQRFTERVVETAVRDMTRYITRLYNAGLYQSAKLARIDLQVMRRFLGE